MIMSVMVISNASSNLNILLIPHFQRRMMKPSVLIAPVTRAFSSMDVTPVSGDVLTVFSVWLLLPFYFALMRTEAFGAVVSTE